jgi:hypothetical protein
VSGQCGHELASVVDERLAAFKAEILTHLREQNKQFIFEKINIVDVDGVILNYFHLI